MGPGSWTDLLRRHVRDTQEARGDIKLRLTGPVGRIALDPACYVSLHLICGGIGITPVLSMFGDIAARQGKRELQNLRHLHFTWILRDDSLLREFALPCVCVDAVRSPLTCAVFTSAGLICTVLRLGVVDFSHNPFVCYFSSAPARRAAFSARE